VSTKEEAERVMKILMGAKEKCAGRIRYHAVDTEVRGWSPSLSPYGNGEVICFSIFCGPDLDFGNGEQLFVDNLDKDGNLRGLVEYFRPYFEDPDVKKVFQNYAFDRAMLLNHGCRVAGFAGDTMHIARLVNSDLESVSLEELGNLFLGPAWAKRKLAEFMNEEKTGNVEALHNSEDPAVREAWIDYSAFDAQVTSKLHEVLLQKLTRDLSDFYEKFWVPFAEVLVDIEERGVHLDQDFLSQQLEAADEDLAQANADFQSFLRKAWTRRYADSARLPELLDCVERFNSNSPKQMKQLLYGTGVKDVARTVVGGLGLPAVKIGKALESTSFEALKTLAGADPKAGKFGIALDELGEEGCVGLHYRAEASKISKAKTSFLEKLTDSDIVDENGRLHTSLSLLTKTGRITSRNPNLQQIPAVDKDRYQIRNAFTPAPGQLFVIADYGQLDLRVLAHTSECPALIGALHAGIDLHSHTAAQMYPHIQKAIDSGEVSLEGGDDRPCVKDAYPSERRSAKAVNFGIAYGLTDYGLSQQLDCPKDQAKDMIDKWYDAYPKVKEWQGKVVEDAETGLLRVYTYRGRPRHLIDLVKGKKRGKARYGKTLFRKQNDDSEFWEYLSATRQAINAPVQGGSADVVVEAMVKAWKDPELLELGYKMILQVHDELIFEGPEENAEKALEAVRRVMENPFLDDYQFRVPLVVDAKVASSWHEAKHA